MKQLRTIVIKVGSSVVVGDDGIRCERISALMRALAAAYHDGYAPILVLSGAVATGALDLPHTAKQVRASRGQWMLNTALAASADTVALKIGLVLLTRHDIANRRRYTSLAETLDALCTAGVVPVVNENDTTALPDAHDFPDNDHLAAILAVALHAERLLLATNVSGIYSGNPNTEKEVALLRRIENVNVQLLDIARGKQSNTGRGGMMGKLKAARLATAVGIPVHIFDGAHPEYIGDILAGKERGTLCTPRAKHTLALSHRERWLLSARNTGASIQIDTGAVTALSSRKSLLAVGVKKLFGAFEKREVIEVLDEAKETVAVGLTEIASDDLTPLLGSRNKSHGVEVIHANNLILL